MGYYLQQGYRVLAVESDSACVACAKHRLAGHPDAFVLQEWIDWPGTGRTCGDLLGFFGVPHYMKVDVDFMDLVCVATLDPASPLPRHLSVEFHGELQEALV